MQNNTFWQKRLHISCLCLKVFFLSKLNKVLLHHKKACSYFYQNHDIFFFQLQKSKFQSFSKLSCIGIIFDNLFIFLEKEIETQIINEENDSNKMTSPN